MSTSHSSLSEQMPSEQTPLLQAASKACVAAPEAAPEAACGAADKQRVAKGPGENVTEASLEARRARFLCGGATALLWWAAGQSWGLFALGWIALTPLFWALHGCSGGVRLRFGFATGWLSFALINWWIAPTIAHAGAAIGVPFVPGALLGVLAVALIACIHGSLVALIAWLWNPPIDRKSIGRGTLGRKSLDRKPLGRENGGVSREGKASGAKRRFNRASWVLCWPPLVALMWAFLDAARSETPLAHAWGALAFTQWRDGPLWQSAFLVGQHGLTFLCVWFAASLALWMRCANPNAWRLPVAVFFACHGWGAWRLARIPFAMQSASASTHIASANRESTSAHEYLEAARNPLIGDTISSGALSASDVSMPAAVPLAGAPNAKGLLVLLVQTDVPSLRKSEDDAFRQAYSLTREAAQRGQFDLIVWPETTATVSLPAHQPQTATRTNATRADAPSNASASDVTNADKATIGHASNAEFRRSERSRSERIRSEAWAETETGFGALGEASRNRANQVGASRDDSLNDERSNDEAMQSASVGQMRALAALSRDLQTPILFGARDERSSGASSSGARSGSGLNVGDEAGSEAKASVENFNRAVMLAPDGRFWSSAKTRLVPFGERAPFAEYLPFLHRLAPQPEVSTSGQAQLLPLPPQPLPLQSRLLVPSSFSGRCMSTHAAIAMDAQSRPAARSVPGARADSVDVPVGAIICFESCFRFPARRLGLAGARALFVLTNDEWFGGTDAPWEHAVMASLRAVENDVPLAQAGNGGFSFAVDRCGRFMVKSSLNQARAFPVFLPLDKAG